MSSLVGSVVFGPIQTPAEAARRYAAQSSYQTTSYTAVQACNCIGPQPGERKCPCQLRAEMEQGATMLRDGVVINGCRYRLVPDQSPTTDQ